MSDPTPSRSQTVLITGAAVRIGRELAFALAEEGYTVAVHYHRSAEAASETASEIRRRGGVAEPFQADLSNPVETAVRLCEAVREKFGSLDVLVNNASLFEPGELHEATRAQWDKLFSVNLQAPFFLCQSFAEGLPEDRSGHIINICDWRGERHPPGHDVYTLTKAGLTALTRMLALELAPRIQVNGIHPGAILAPEGATADHERRAGQNIPLRKTGSPDDIVSALRYLLRSPFVTGEFLHVTGGEHLT